MEAPIVSVADPDEKSSQSLWKLMQIVYRVEARQRLFQKSTDMSLKSEAIAMMEEIKSIVLENNMFLFYQNICERIHWEMDDSLFQNMKESSDKIISDLDVKLEEAQKDGGDIEQLDILLKKGKHYLLIGNKSGAIDIFDQIASRPKVPSNRKIDSLLEKSRLALFHNDMTLLASTLDTANDVIEKLGDWDRRNKLKVLQGFHALISRDMKKAAALFFEGIATFSSVEICSYSDFMVYACLTNLISMNRKDLKKSILDNAHVIAFFVEHRFLQDLLTSFYSCNYHQFMKMLVLLDDTVRNDRYLGPHATYIFRELRILAFSQFLEAYKSVTLSSMATAFGVPSSMLDNDLSHYIASGRILAKIDRVGDVIETVRADQRNTQYQDIIAKGDLLLNQVQKLARLLD